MRLLGFLEPAQREFEEAINFYNQQRENIGEEFAAEVLNAIKRILSQPEAWTKLSKRTRRCRTKRFPYGVIYQIHGDGILIVAVAHLRRKPRYWRDRLRAIR
jgi:plasmid stabilization system protein ParE